MIRDFFLPSGGLSFHFPDIFLFSTKDFKFAEVNEFVCGVGVGVVAPAFVIRPKKPPSDPRSQKPVPLGRVLGGF